jgi:hypothetical protein
MGGSTVYRDWRNATVSTNCASAELARLVARKKDDSSGLFRITIEHTPQRPRSMLENNSSYDSAIESGSTAIFATCSLAGASLRFLAWLAVKGQDKIAGVKRVAPIQTLKARQLPLGSVGSGGSNRGRSK